MRTFLTIFRIESRIAFFRHLDSFFFGIVMPMVVTLIIGFVSGNKTVDGTNLTFIGQSFGALVTISICATGLMGFPMNVALYRDKKILKRFQVTPVSPFLILMAQCMGCVLLVLVSFVCIYLICSLTFGYEMRGSLMSFIPALFLMIGVVYSIGILVASLARNMKTANLLTTIVYFPMLLFSGATIPYEIMPEKIREVVDFIPLTQGIKMLKGISLGEPLSVYSTQVFLLMALMTVCLALSYRFFRWS